MERAQYGERVKVKTAEYFFRDSSRNLDTKQFSELMKYQDELAEFLNDGRESENFLQLTTGRRLTTYGSSGACLRMYALIISAMSA